MVAVELSPEITASFVAEARSYLPRIAESLADLDDVERLTEAYRFAHTIKSSAAMMGHTGLSQIAALLEDDLDCILCGEGWTQVQAAQLARSTSRIERLLAAVAGEQVDVEAIIADEVADRLGPEAPQSAPESPATVSQVSEPAPESPESVARVSESAPDVTETVSHVSEPALDTPTTVSHVPPPDEIDTIGLVEAAGVEGVGVLDPDAEECQPVLSLAVSDAVPAVVESGADDRLSLVVDALAEAVLALGRDLAGAGSDVSAHCRAILTCYQELERLTGPGDSEPSGTAAAGLIEAPQATGESHQHVGETSSVSDDARHGSSHVDAVQIEAVELDPAHGARSHAELEASIRAMLEAELRFEIEEEVRARLAAPGGAADAAADASMVPGVRFAPRLSAPQPAARVDRLPAAPEAPGALAGVDPEMWEIFEIEAAEHLKRIDADVSALETAPHDDERLRSLRRTVHTLKGAAAMMGFDGVAQLAHLIEDRLEAVVDGASLAVSSEYATLLEDLSRLELMVGGAGVSAGEPAPDPNVAADALATSVPALVPHAAKPAAAPPPSAGGSLAVPVRLELLDRLLTLAGETTVSLSSWPQVLSSSRAALADLRRAAARLQDLHETVRATGADARLRQMAVRRAAVGSGRVPAGAMRLAAASLPAAAPAIDGEFDVLELDRYSPVDHYAHELAQIVAETSAAEREIASSLETAAEIAAAQRRHAVEIQDRLLAVRLVPLADLAGRLNRAVQGVALRREKRIDFEFRGGDVAVDRAVLDAVADALLHLVRNAADHGIELPAERLAHGKPEHGLVCVSARQEQGDVLVEVSDDGAGVDVERLAAAALAAGVATPPDATAGAGAVELMFMPGVSTAPSVDDVSGRGVGLDAVANALAQVRGSVEVVTHAGRGTTFTLRFPVTLAQARVVLAEVAGSPVALPAASVRYVARLAALPLERFGEVLVARHDGQPYPIAALADVLGWPYDERPEDPPVLFVESAGRRAAWIAGATGSQEDVVVRSLGRHLRSPRGVSGAAILQDGRVMLLLHLPDLLAAPVVSSGGGASRHAETPVSLTGGGTASGVSAGNAVRASLRVLVVDDSPTIRKLLVRMLKDVGWQPSEAKDGAEALEAIRVRRPDLVLADVEMPRLDGYGLLSALRSNAPTADLPVLMLTSRTADRHRRRAMELGATGYLTKPYRSEEVVAAIRRAALVAAGTS